METASAANDADDDARVLARVAGGDREALAALYHRHGAALLRYLLQLTTDRPLAEEMLQDTLLAIWKSANTYGGRASVRTWIFGIARRQAHNHLRQREIASEPAEALLDLPAPDADPQDAVLAQAAREQLAQALRDLAPLHREVLVLVLVNELSYQEAAEVLSVPIGTIKSRLNHARIAVRMLLGAERSGTND